LDPIAVLDAGKFHGLPGFDSKDEKASDTAFDRFESEFYRRGSLYPVFVHGAEVGTAQVTEPVGITCVSTTAAVILSRPLPHDEMGLAMESLGGRNVHEDRDPVLSQGENARFRDAAIAYFSQKGISRAAVSGTRIDGVHSVFLGTHWPSALVGSAFLRTEDAA